MMQNRLYTTIIGILFWLTSFSQNEELRKIDNSLTSTFNTMMEADYLLRYDSLAPAFIELLMQQLVKPITFNSSLDSLSKYLDVITSADKQIKFYSWDAKEGGTQRKINCFAQFKSDDGRIIVIQLNTQFTEDSTDYTDSGIYEVHEIVIDGIKYYLTFAWGTYGSGHQHKIIQLFSIKSDRLIKCKTCFADNNDLIINYPRADKANLTFDEKTNIITYNEFKYDENDEYYKPTGQMITLELKNGVFKKK